jgi:hypothetical protein
MIFDSKDKEHMIELVRCLGLIGLTPTKDKARCSQLKNEIEGQDVESVEKFISDRAFKSFIPIVGHQEKKSGGFSPSFGSVQSSGFTCLIHGMPGCGKTWLASKVDSPAYADCERGSLKIKSLNKSREIINDWKHLTNFVDWFFSDDNTGMNSLVIDSLTEAEKMCQQFVCEREKIESLEKAGFGKGYIWANSEMSKLIMKCRNKSVEQGKSVIFVGHTKVKSTPNVSGEDFDRNCVGVHKDLNEFLYGACDHVLYAHWKMNLVQKDDNNKDSGVIAKETGVLCVHTGGSPNIVSKNRCYPSLPKIVNVPPMNASAEEFIKFWNTFR